MSKRAIAHMDLDTFFVSCERLLDSRLNGKPVVIGGSSDRGVVASCSYEARKFGVHSAMPMKRALQLCPEVIVVRGSSATYSKYSKMVTEIVREACPVYEKTSIDEFYMDFTGMDKFFGCMKYASELRQRIMRETGLPISFGLSENKTVSKIATGEAKPNNEIFVEYGKEKFFLGPLSIKKIPMVGLKTYQKLASMGIEKIQTLQEMPVEMIEGALGQYGTIIWNKANGIDYSPVKQYSERKSISTEQTFEKDTVDLQMLKSILTAMIEKLAFQLRKRNKLTSCITIKIRYSDFKTETLQHKIHYTSADHELIPMVMELFSRIYPRRVPIRLIGVRFSELLTGSFQINLFEDYHKMADLYAAMDKIRIQFGDRSIVRASGMDAKTRNW